MTTYLTPGVYVEEHLGPRNGSPYGDARAIAAFVGIASKGPATPTLVTSWTQYTNLFGGFLDDGSLLPFAVRMFFDNGGARCYIVRAVRSDAVAATVTLKDSTPVGDDPENPDGPKDAIKVTSLAPGIAGNTLSVQVVPTGVVGRFTLRVKDGGVDKEIFEDMSANPKDPRYITAIVNSPVRGSRLIKVTNLKSVEGYVYDATNDVMPAQTGALAGGADGSAPYDMVTATKQLGELDENFDVNLPGEISTQTLNALLEWGESTGKHFFVIDGPRGAEGSTSAQILAGYSAMVTGATSLNQSSHGAIYGPWILAPDPSTSIYGAVRMLPPGGMVLGKYARNDAVRHVGKAPAGIETRLDTALATECKFTPTELDTANDTHINIIRNVPGHGICIMGARTLKLTLPDFYVPVRRTLMYLRKQLSDISLFAVMEPNGPDLWTQLTLVISRYLGTLARAGVLAGQTESEAYFVRCNADINPPSEIAAGRVNVDVGVALRYPAEFVIIRIGQYDGGTDTQEVF